MQEKLRNSTISHSCTAGAVAGSIAGSQAFTADEAHDLVICTSTSSRKVVILSGTKHR